MDIVVDIISRDDDGYLLAALCSDCNFLVSFSSSIRHFSNKHRYLALRPAADGILLRFFQDLHVRDSVLLHRLQRNYHLR